MTPLPAALTTQAPAEPATHPLDALLPEICNLIDGCKLDWQAQGCWSEWDQSVRDRITAYNLARLATPTPVEPAPVKWGDPENVGMLIRQLQTLDPTLPVYAAFHTEYQGKRRAFVRGVAVSREHVAGRLVESGPAVNSIVVWSAPVEPAKRYGDLTGTFADKTNTFQPPVAQSLEAPEGSGAATQDAKGEPQERQVSNLRQSPDRQCDTGSACVLASAPGDPFVEPGNPANQAGANVNNCDVRDTTYDTPLPVFYPAGAQGGEGSADAGSGSECVR